MKAYLSSILGVFLIFLLFRVYLSWASVSDLDHSFFSYIKAVEQRKVRSILELKLYRALSQVLHYCNTLPGEQRDLEICNEMFNHTVLSFSRTYGLHTCSLPVVYVPPVLRFVCSVAGKVDGVRFLIPRGAEVRGCG